MVGQRVLLGGGGQRIGLTLGEDRNPKGKTRVLFPDGRRNVRQRKQQMILLVSWQGGGDVEQTGPSCSSQHQGGLSVTGVLRALRIWYLKARSVCTVHTHALTRTHALTHTVYLQVTLHLQEGLSPKVLPTRSPGAP